MREKYQISRYVTFIGIIILVAVIACSGMPVSSDAQKLEPHEGMAFAVIGDYGKGNKGQFEVAQQLMEAHDIVPFSLLITTGDNIYGGDSVVERAKQVIEKPYGDLFDSEVEFRPSLGNHDVDDHPDLKTTMSTLGMSDRFYDFTVGPVDFFALDSNNIDDAQLKWLDERLGSSENKWQVVYMHHPLYSSGKHGSSINLREKLEPILLSGGVDLVFAGHDHVYERTFPQQGIVYIVTGGGAATRRAGSSEFTAKSSSQLHFVLIKVAEEELRGEVIDSRGSILDAFTVSPRP